MCILRRHVPYSDHYYFYIIVVKKEMSGVDFLRRFARRLPRKKKREDSQLGFTLHS
jgi:hypothetical protein